MDAMTRQVINDAGMNRNATVKMFTPSVLSAAITPTGKWMTCCIASGTDQAGSLTYAI